MANTLPDGLKMWVCALDGQGGWGELSKHLEVFSIRKMTNQNKKIWRESRPLSSVAEFVGLLEVQNMTTVYLSPKLELNLGPGGFPGEC